MHHVDKCNLPAALVMLWAHQPEPDLPEDNTDPNEDMAGGEPRQQSLCAGCHKAGIKVMAGCTGSSGRTRGLLPRGCATTV